MKNTRLIMVSLLALSTFSCGIIKKNNRSSAAAGSAVPADAEDAISGDATAAKGETPTAEAKVDPKMALTGRDLYAKLCASCHQTFDKTDVPKVPFNRINQAIAQVPTMVGLKDTPAADLEAIAAALSELSPGKGKGKAGEEEGTED